MKLFKTIASYTAILLAGLLIGYIVPRIPKMLEPKFEEGNYNTYLQKNNTEVLMYGTSTCQYCEKTRTYFKQNKINFVELDIGKIESAANEHSKLGGEGVPLVIIGQRKIRGFQPEVFNDAIKLLVKSN